MCYPLILASLTASPRTLFMIGLGPREVSEGGPPDKDHTPLIYEWGLYYGDAFSGQMHAF